VANRRQFSTARKRVTSWHGANIAISDLVTATPQFNTLVPEATMETFPTPTIVRIRGNIGVASDVSSTDSAFAHVSMGIIKVTAAALAGSAVPTPTADIGSDWIWWSNIIVAKWTATVNEGSIWRNVMVDSKAMRKVGLNEALIFVAELINCGLTSQANLCGAIRVLLKAP